MPATRVLTQEEREAVLARVKPSGGFKPPRERIPFGSQPLLWEQRLGNLDEFRKHSGMGRAVLEKLTDPVKNQSVQNSMLNRLRRLFPDESWSTFVDGNSIYLKFNGPRRTYVQRHAGENSDERSGGNVGEGLFSAAG